jgi:hypothetical protein
MVKKPARITKLTKTWTVSTETKKSNSNTETMANKEMKKRRACITNKAGVFLTLKAL